MSKDAPLVPFAAAAVKNSPFLAAGLAAQGIDRAQIVRPQMKIAAISPRSGHKSVGSSVGL